MADFNFDFHDTQKQIAVDALTEEQIACVTALLQCAWMYLNWEE